MNDKIKELLPNPFAVDYIGTDEPVDLYTEKEMLEFAELIIQECVQICDIAAKQSRDTYEELLSRGEPEGCLAVALGASHQAKKLSESLKIHFGVE